MRGVGDGGIPVPFTRREIGDSVTGIYIGDVYAHRRFAVSRAMQRIRSHRYGEQPTHAAGTETCSSTNPERTA